MSMVLKADTEIITDKVPREFVEDSTHFEPGEDGELGGRGAGSRLDTC